MLENASTNYDSIKIDGANKSAIEVCKQRIIAVSVIFFVVTVLISIKLFYVSSSGSVIKTEIINDQLPIVRGKILDRNDKILAVSLPSYSLHMNGTKVRKPIILLAKLSKIIPTIDKSKILKKINDQKKFIYIARQLTPKVAEEVHLLGEPSLDFDIESLRLYPLEKETGYLLGYMGFDDKPHAGVERSFDEKLKQGKDVKLTLDSRLQSIVYDKLKDGFIEFNAKAAVGIIMDVTNGEILAAVSIPDFNPNLRSQHKSGNSNNRVTMSNYEMGSIFKSFTIASGLNENLINLDSRFDASKPYEVKGKIVTDFHPKNRILSLKEVFVYSSNIGSAMIAMQLGMEKQNHYLIALGLNKTIDSGIKEINAPLFPEVVSEADIVSRSYGYHISVNPLQVIAALAATVNGGKYIEPFVVDDPIYKKRPSVQVFKPEVSNIMRYLYRSVVSDGGTASKINIKEYKIGGKTGTASPVENGQYNTEKNIVSFISFLPINDPKYAIFILLDNPNPHKKPQATAGWTAVPIARDIVREMAPVVGEPGLNFNMTKNINKEAILQ
ncbi:MAG: Peptidoglycan synthase FtsI [Alphaproteobacteria bacterium MarineAlpha9_Bin1]|nr:MAG: Peptidoglycan synthase FtsI [Alphaproteobacteria bacterium MarineAlpha9_Bin1]